LRDSNGVLEKLTAKELRLEVGTILSILRNSSASARFSLRKKEETFNRRPPGPILDLDLQWPAREYGHYAVSGFTGRCASTSGNRGKAQRRRETAEMSEVRQPDGMVQHGTEARRRVTPRAYVPLPDVFNNCSRRRTLARPVTAGAVFKLGHAHSSRPPDRSCLSSRG
jgi:hypothetical protein